MRRSILCFFVLVLVCIAAFFSYYSYKPSDFFHQCITDTDREMLSMMTSLSDSVLYEVDAETKALVEAKMTTFEVNDNRVEDLVAYQYCRAITAAQSKDQISYVANRFKVFVGQNSDLNDKEKLVLYNLFSVLQTNCDLFLTKEL